MSQNIAFDRTKFVMYTPWTTGTNAGHLTINPQGPTGANTQGFTVQINDTSASLTAYIATGLTVNYNIDGGANQTLVGNNTWAVWPLTGITSGCVLTMTWNTASGILLFDSSAMLVLGTTSATISQPPGWGQMYYKGDTNFTANSSVAATSDGYGYIGAWPDQMVRMHGTGATTGMKIYGVGGANSSRIVMLKDGLPATSGSGAVIGGGGNTNVFKWYTVASGISTDASNHDFAVGWGYIGDYPEFWSVCLVGGVASGSAPTPYTTSAVSIGDSITAANVIATSGAGTSFDSWFYRLCQANNWQPFNRGIGGSFVTVGQANSAVTRFNADVGSITANPTVCILMHGANDIHDAIGQSTYASNYRTLIGQFFTKWPSIAVYQFGTVNRNDDSGSHNATRTAYNSAVDGISAITTGHWLTDGVITPATDTSDNLHPNPAGSLKIKNFMQQVLTARKATGASTTTGVQSITL